MKLSVSNLAWGGLDFADTVAALAELGITGVEIAPTALWPSAPDVTDTDLTLLRQVLDDHGLRVSGLQSLLYGHPEFQLLEPDRWPGLRDHLLRVLDLGHRLDADVAVFGSPKNRLRGALDESAADELAAQFFASIVPELQSAGVVLTLEPNAPAYGADYLTTYPAVVRLADLIGSEYVQPQIDTGCLAMVGEQPAEAAELRLPRHVHVSAPHLAPVPGEADHAPLAGSLSALGYDHWVVLEMLADPAAPKDTVVRCARWLVDTYGAS